ncbi:MAG: hypothetical protein NC120_02685 [Ruminococcus sp.]|nr:hypothetical protein [Ruminococcus sp.]
MIILFFGMTAMPETGCISAGRFIDGDIKILPEIKDWHKKRGVPKFIKKIVKNP